MDFEGQKMADSAQVKAAVEEDESRVVRYGRMDDIVTAKDVM